MIASTVTGRPAPRQPARSRPSRTISICRSRESEVSSIAFPRLGDAALVDGGNLDLVAARQDNIARGFADQSPRDGGDVRN